MHILISRQNVSRLLIYQNLNSTKAVNQANIRQDNERQDINKNTNKGGKGHIVDTTQHLNRLITILFVFLSES